MDGIGLQLAGQITVARFAEPIGENLVDDGTLGPVGSGEVCGNTAHLPHVAGLHVGVVAGLEQSERTGSIGDVEEIEVQTGPLQSELAGEGLISAQTVQELHVHSLSGMAVLHGQIAGDGLGLHGCGDADVQAAGLAGGQGSEGVLVAKLLTVEKNAHRDAPVIKNLGFLKIEN